MTQIKTVFLFLYFVSTILLFSQIYRDPSADVEDRVTDLLNKMTLDEKIGQMVQSGFWNFNDSLLNHVRNGEFGSFLNAGNVEDKYKLQTAAVEESRLGIPLIFGRDVIHGYRTMLPIPLGMAATWNPNLIQEGSKMAAREAAEDGVHWTFAPMIDITRDPRWGRIAETCGEDPYLTSVLGAAMVKGFQGDDLSDENTIAACAKHYVGYGATEGGKDYNTTLIPERELRNIYFPPFHSALKAGVSTLMSAFNDLNGIPTSGNDFTLRKILRDEWNFNGFVVSDWESILEMIEHGYAKDDSEAALKAAKAGVNMEMASKCYSKNLKKHVESGAIDINWINELVSGILRIKFKLGLFENPYTRSFDKSAILSEDNKNTAKQTAIESIVMLQNNDNTLPLDKNIKNLAIIGPLADAPWDQLGTWTVDGKAENSITPLEAIKEQFENSMQIEYVKGIESVSSNDNKYFRDAINAVDKADAAILFLGEDQQLSGEARCRAFIDLPGIQEELINELSKTGKPLVLVIMAGRPLTFGTITDKVQSILYAWHPGTMGGPAIAEIIFGDVSPSGKLPVTFPRTVGQIPLYYNSKNTGRPPEPDQFGRKLGTPENPFGYRSFYLDVDYTPAYYFGFGLSYTSFEYSELSLSTNRIKAGESLDISVLIENIGNFEAKEIVQLYLRDLYGSVTRPVKELKKFEKIFLEPGETKKVNFTISEDDLKFYDINMDYKAEPGEFELFVGSSSIDKDLLISTFVFEN